MHAGETMHCKACYKSYFCVELKLDFKRLSPINHALRPVHPSPLSSCCWPWGVFSSSLQWRHNGHDSVSNRQHHNCLLNRLFRRRSKKTLKHWVTGLRAGNLPVAGEFPAQMASNAENMSIWWRHHDDWRAAPSVQRLHYFASVGLVIKIFHSGSWNPPLGINGLLYTACLKSDPK